MTKLEVEIDGHVEAFAGGSVGTPRLCYDVRPGHKAIGPWGFHLTIAEPSERVLAMKTGTEHTVRISSQGQQLTVPVVRSDMWTGEDDIQKVFFIYSPRDHPNWEPVA